MSIKLEAAGLLDEMVDVETYPVVPLITVYIGATNGCSENAGSGCGLWAAGCGLRAAGCGLRAAGCGLRFGGLCMFADS